jgi:hypothetical protein
MSALMVVFSESHSVLSVQFMTCALFWPRFLLALAFLKMARMCVRILNNRPAPQLCADSFTPQIQLPENMPRLEYQPPLLIHAVAVCAFIMRQLGRVGGRQPYVRPQQFAAPPHHHHQQQQQPVYGGEYQVTILDTCRAFFVSHTHRTSSMKMEKNRRFEARRFNLCMLSVDNSCVMRVAFFPRRFILVTPSRAK